MFPFTFPIATDELFLKRVHPLQQCALHISDCMKAMASPKIQILGSLQQKKMEPSKFEGLEKQRDALFPASPYSSEIDSISCNCAIG